MHRLIRGGLQVIGQLETPARRSAAIAYRAEAPHFRKVTDPSGKYLRMLLPGHHFTSETGKPELPVYSRLTEVPEGMDVVVTLSGISSRGIKFSDQGAADARTISRSAGQNQKPGTG
ncbi:MAG: hypothetical protein MZV63_08995 [Marinilabiliales bacterium]|nr:hypothetical protein [Marinilabiliales bacterium]